MNPSRPLVALTSLSMLLLAACGGSSSQREALEAQSNSAQSGTSGAAAPAAAPAPAPAAAPAAAPANGDTNGSAPADTTKTTSTKHSDAAAPAAVSGPAAKPAPAPAGKPAAAPANPASVPAAAKAPTAPKPILGPSDVGVTASEIKVGHIGIYSGPVGSFGQNLSYACRATLQAINDNGGINGRKLNVVVRDDGWDASKGSNAVRDLVEREKVFALACSQSVPTNDAITPYLDAQKVPNVGSDGWGEAQYAGAWSFPVGASGVNEAEDLAAYQAQHGTKRVGILYWNNTTGKAYNDAYKQVIEAAGGQVVVSQAANFDDPATTTFIAQCRAANVDTISTMIDPGIFARLVREAAAQGYKPTNGYSGGAALYFEATPSLTGPTAEGTISSIDWIPDDPSGPAAHDPGFREYKDTVEKYYPHIDHSNWTKAAFVGGKLFGDALKKLGLDVTRQGLKDELDGITSFDTGLGPKLTFRTGQHRSNKTSYLAQLQKVDGKIEWKYLAGPFVNPRRGND